MRYQPSIGVDAAEKIQGQSVDDAKKFSAEDMLKLYAPVSPNRQKCCLLS
jgi:hypothetical protein